MSDRYSHRDNERGLRGEQYVKRKHDLEDSDVQWCDLRNPRTGSANLARCSRSLSPTCRLRSATSSNFRAMIFSSTVGTLISCSPA